MFMEPSIFYLFPSLGEIESILYNEVSPDRAAKYYKLWWDFNDEG